MSFKGSLEAFAIFQSRSENLTGIFWLPDSNEYKVNKRL